jgi:endonuclease III
MMNRQEHLQWCKDRAMEYVKAGDFSSAVASMLSDLGKHKETEASSRGLLAQLGMLELMSNPTKERIEKYIKGFN